MNPFACSAASDMPTRVASVPILNSRPIAEVTRSSLLRSLLMTPSLTRVVSLSTALP